MAKQLNQAINSKSKRERKGIWRRIRWPNLGSGYAKFMRSLRIVERLDEDCFDISSIISSLSFQSHITKWQLLLDICLLNRSKCLDKIVTLICFFTNYLFDACRKAKIANEELHCCRICQVFYRAVERWIRLELSPQNWWQSCHRHKINNIKEVLSMTMFLSNQGESFSQYPCE